MKAVSYKTLICTLLIGSLAACATAPSRHPSGASVAYANGVPPACVAHTGTRVTSGEAKCAGFGHSWTQDEIRRTGAIDAGQGLRMLDPSVTVESH